MTDMFSIECFTTTVLLTQPVFIFKLLSSLYALVEY